MNSKSKKRIRLGATLTVGVALLTTAAACGSSGSGGSGSSSAKKVTMLTAAGYNDFYFTLTCDVKTQAKKDNIDLTTTDISQSDRNVEGETALLDQAAANRPDAIMVTSPDLTAFDGALSQVKSENIKLITYDGIVTDNSIPDAQVETNLTLSGADGADALAQAIGGKGKVLVVDIEPGFPSTNERTDGFEAEMKAKYPNVDVLPVQYDKLESSNDVKIVSAELSRYPDLAGIYFTYDEATIGAMPALVSAGKAGKVKVVSNDADPILVKYLQQGYISALVPHNVGLFAKELVATTVSVLDGKTVSGIVKIPPVVITKANLSTPTSQSALYRTSC